MPGFKTHLRRGKRWASIAAVCTLLPVYLYTETLPTVAGFAVLAFLSGLLGAVLPDLDSQSSIPRRYLEWGLATALLSVISFTLGVYWEEIRTSLDGLVQSTPHRILVLGLGLGSGLIGFVLLLRVVRGFIQRITPYHRGPLHTVVFWTIASLSVAAVFFLAIESLTGDLWLATFAGFTIGGSLLGGISVHLQMDGEFPWPPLEKTK